MKMNSLDNIQKNDDEFLEKDSLNNVQKMALQGTLHSQPQGGERYPESLDVKDLKRKRIPFNKLDNILKNDDKFLENLDFTSDKKEKRTKDKTELEILSKIPPSIRYSKLDKSTTFTSSRSACTPFEYKVGPSNEEDKTTLLVTLIYVGRFLLTIEVKTRFKYNNEESLDERYEKDLKKKTVK
ncbi:hypothetical protein C2G38_2212545 [Gigaspora rosea]|uniref:Uncharacterized protein n=1 Tax=Gigaspora rosea TaxID=44941 RepID=A0A397UG86_9GLOM|nr:hypothetical protein C2G38_2212545 [Gigaspora rosea]